MRLGVRCPARQPTWDAILITAAGPDQARLYQLHLQRAVDRGRIAKHTLVLAVPDPLGRRIGSGGATLGAIRELDAALRSKGDGFSGKRVLLVHAGGDSKRVPWANAIGKAFLPLPILAQDACADEPVPLLFDHILAVSSLAAAQLPDRGGLLIMTGDVLPCFDASKMTTPRDGALVVTVPTSLAVAANHGVILSQKTDDGTSACFAVEDLLQKPSRDEMYARGAVSSDSTALLDTGIFVVVGDAWDDLIRMSLAELDPLRMLLDNAQEMSLYEEIAGAWVPARHSWLRNRPLGKLLVQELGAQRLYHYCAYDLQFLHFGTSSEILQHLASDDSGPIHRRQFTLVSTNEDSATRLASSSVILASRVDGGAAVGDSSLVFNSSLSSKVKVGSSCVVSGVHHTEDFLELSLPDGHCLWDVPLKDSLGRVMLCCGLGDNPKLSATQGGTFCGRTWDQVLGRLQIEKNDVWTDASTQQDLWHAKLFSVQSAGERTENFTFAMWLMGSCRDTSISKAWLAAKRLSFAELQEFTDFEAMHLGMSDLHAELAAEFATGSLEDGLMDRNFSLLAREMQFGTTVGAETFQRLLSRVPAEASVPASRRSQVRSDLSRGIGDKNAARVHEAQAFEAVAAETSAAVCQDGVGSKLLRLQPSRSSIVNLPVRLDIVGGWSDTPPWSIERKGCVLNMAVYLNGAAPVGAEVLLKKIPGVCLRDDTGNNCWIEEPTSLRAPFDENDPFRLVKAALVVTGWTSPENIVTSSPWGLEINTRASVPRGSGLGTSSILAAAVIRGLLEVSGGNSSKDSVAALVLVLEQLMGTGGGWQDQVGGIYPGLKLTTSLPSKPLTFSIETVPLPPDFREELEHRMLLVFTGQVRLAHKVLQKVVKRYLQRDSLLLSSIQRLVKLAKLGRDGFLQQDLDSVGKIMQEAWQIHQELDPFCSNVLVDSIFKKISHLSCGYKLVGAGGGGFAIVMAKDRDSAGLIREVLSSSFKDSIELYRWSLMV
ncbi:bifunctional fucokinase/fucose pyrophosphorylase-like [Selaginella moellendorffii]|uniref:bifunctional fucokinase/fucose pyrophosphorylase-like n=1 Tax=Selaginella moellendorffii TaxID=88036 RepID=UPI000D1C4027|nr:bifunctional fucokinase/fucose pyrophosphorylase-like [Selaginella moellendorffii]|eukprot:XP_024517725.1 bifunctional fucokinase/fucose pyrophosphorylase-like [Selaginella moellendorffii]